jgi:hypothetical protein
MTRGVQLSLLPMGSWVALQISGNLILQTTHKTYNYKTLCDIYGEKQTNIYLNTICATFLYFTSLK